MTPDPILRRAEPADAERLAAAYARSRELLHPWMSPPADIERELEKVVYLLCLEPGGELAGQLSLTGIVRGVFQSAYLSYCAFVPQLAKASWGRGWRS